MPAKKPAAKTVSKKGVTAMKPVSAVKQSKAVVTKKPAKLTNVIKPAITTKPARSLHLGMHLIIAGSAICVILLLGVIEKNTFATKLSNAEDAVPATIGIEHNAPLSMSILFARKEGAGYVSITNQSSETIHINLPSSWSRTEVTGTTLKEVTQDIPVFGFSRWTLPGKAGMKLLMPSAPNAVFFDSTSTSTAAIDLKAIDLTTLGVSNKVVLVQKQTLVPLWGQAE
jgi:hypothetical protein